MTLNITTGIVPSDQAVQDQITRLENDETLLTPTQVALLLGQAYFDYSIEGTLPGADLTVGGTKSILETGFITDNTPATIDNIAAAICNYWATNITPGVPAHGGTAVVSVVIDGASKIPAMKAAIQGLITTSPAGGLTDFYQVTQDIVKTIPCIITELIPPNATPTPFPETIS